VIANFGDPDDPLAAHTLAASDLDIELVRVPANRRAQWSTRKCWRKRHKNESLAHG